MEHRFLISRLSALGDVVCSLPAAAALKKGFPASHITWVVDPRFAEIVECCSMVDAVVKARPGLSPWTWPNIDGEFDAALDLQGLFKSGVVVARAKAGAKVGFHWQREGAWLFSRQVLPDPTSLHVVDQYVDVARALGGIADKAVFALAPKPTDTVAIQAKLNSSGVAAPYVVMNPGAGWSTKRWPLEHCARLIGLLAEKGLQSVLIGGRSASDREVVAQVVERCGHPVTNFDGETTVGELVALISSCAVHVGGDTGSSHIAAALDRPAVGLYSITRPRRSCPYGRLQWCLYNARGLAEIQPEGVLATMMEAMA